MTLEQYKKELAHHDWYYYFSDDHGVWQRGESESSRIFGLAKDGNDDFKRAYNDSHKRHFDTPSFVTPDRPYTLPFKVN